jgi:hypothetical protein
MTKINTWPFIILILLYVVCISTVPMSMQAEQDKIVGAHLNRLLDSRGHPKTICPSEVARAISGDELEILGVDSWRDLMPQIRRIVAGLRTQGTVEVLQKGNVLEGELGDSFENVVGPIRLRKKTHGKD